MFSNNQEEEAQMPSRGFVVFSHEKHLNTSPGRRMEMKFPAVSSNCWMRISIVDYIPRYPEHVWSILR